MKSQVASLASRINANQEEMRARVSAIQYKMMEVTVNCSQEETEAAVHSAWPELEETVKHQVEDILACVDQRTQGLCRALNEMIFMKCRWP
jgi:hypothetical protein